VKITTHKRSVGTVSVNFLGNNGIGELKDYVRAFVNFVDAARFKDKQDPLYNALYDPLDIDMIDPSGEDRSTWFENVQYKYKYGVDVSFKYDDQIITTTENASTIIIGNDTTGGDITVTKPTP
jgi:hypothetical protein